MKSVLNVGGSSKSIPIPARYQGWRHDLLDIDASLKPDIILDARELHRLPAGFYDTVYCSSNLEHYYEHDARKVLAGFLHVLRPDGFAEIRLPDLKSLFRHVGMGNLDLNDTLYTLANGAPIRVHDVVYGYAPSLEVGNEFYAHKSGWSEIKLTHELKQAGFAHVVATAAAPGSRNFLMEAFAFKYPPSEEQVRELIPGGA